MNISEPLTAEPPTADPRPDAPVHAAAPSDVPRKPGGLRQQALPTLERLAALHPKLFGARFMPLKLGIYEELLAAHPGDFTPDELKRALSVHARSTRYLESVAAGHRRHDLRGKPVEDVAPEHLLHAMLEVCRRRAARGQDARAWLASAVGKAVQSRGLPRETWDALPGAADATAVQALDAAFAELRSRQARQEALRRAYEASGATVEAFAGMYGMPVAEVRRLLSGAAGKSASASAMDQGAPAGADRSG